MNREIAIRRRILNIYNKRNEDFPSLRAYNDYLEEVEDMIFKLIDGIDAHVIEARIKLYQEENADQIIALNARKAEERTYALQKQNGHTTAITAVVPEQVQAPGLPSGIYAPAVAAGSLFTQPKPAVLVNHDHEPYENEETKRLRREKGAKAGGWTPQVSRRRAFEEAFASLWVS